MSATVAAAVPASRAAERKFVALIAACMGMTALGIDSVLPAFGEMRREFGLAPGSTSVSWVITAYFLGLAFGQLFYGPLSDRRGRKPLLLVGIGLYIAGAIGSALAPSLGVLVLFRLVSGLGAAGPRSLALAMVRDRFEGDQMARTMSFAMAIFILVPVIAPSIGAVVMKAGSWPAVFWFAVVVAVGVGVASRRMPETLPPERRRSSGLGELASAARVVVSTRTTVAYGLAATCLFGSMAAYLGNSEVIIDEVFGLGDRFPLVFGALAVSMGVATLISARLVVALGLRGLLRRAVLVLIGMCAVFLLVALTSGGTPPFFLFFVVMAVLLPLHTMLMPNFNTAAMSPLGRVAGVGAALLGTVTTAGGALLGSVVDRAFDGTVRPLAVAMFALACCSATLVYLADHK